MAQVVRHGDAQGPEEEASFPPGCEGGRPLPLWLQDLVVQHDCGLPCSLVEQRGVILARCAENNMLEAALSIFVRLGRLPEAEELLFCSASTTAVEVELLLRRCFSTGSQRQPDGPRRVYCLCNWHFLSAAVQQVMVGQLKSFQQKPGHMDADAAPLVIITECGAMIGKMRLCNDHLVSTLEQRYGTVEIKTLPREVLQEVVSHCVGRHVQAVVAESNGMGKSHHILRQVWNMQQQNGKAAVLHSVDVCKAATPSTLVDSLLADPTDASLPTAFHFNFAHDLPPSIDVLLFELFIVGVVHDQSSGKVYKRRAQDAYFLELPHHPRGEVADHLPFSYTLLPQVCLTMTAETLEGETPQLESGPDGWLRVVMRKNEPLALAGKILRAMKVEAFHPDSPEFDIRWTARDAAEESLPAVFELIEELCSAHGVRLPSFLALSQLVWVLGGMVRQLERWNMMNVSLLQRFDPGLKAFKHYLSGVAIHTAVTLTTHPNSISKSEGQRVEDSFTADGCSQPITVLKLNENQQTIGCFMMKLQGYADWSGELPENLQNSLNLSDMKLQKDWMQAPQRDWHDVIQFGEGRHRWREERPFAADVGIVDQYLLLLRASQCLRHGVPVVLAGETGCGKTWLVEQLARVLRMRLFTLRLHSGVTDAKVLSLMQDTLRKISSDAATPSLVFFDRLSAAGCCPSLLKKIIVDRVCGNLCIPACVRVIGSSAPQGLHAISQATPFRSVLRSGSSLACLPTSQPLSPSLCDLTLHVGPARGATLHECERRYVNWVLQEVQQRRAEQRKTRLPAGLLPAITEYLTGRAASPRELPTVDGYELRSCRAFLEKRLAKQVHRERLGVLAELLAHSQRFVRDFHDGRGCFETSLRDIMRASKVMEFLLLKSFGSVSGAEGERGFHRGVTDDELRAAMVATLFFCYAARLPVVGGLRSDYWQSLVQLCCESEGLNQQSWLKMRDCKSFENEVAAALSAFEVLLKLQQEGAPLQDVRNCIKSILRNAEEPPLAECCFMLHVSLLTHTPLLLVLDSPSTSAEPELSRPSPSSNFCLQHRCSHQSTAGELRGALRSTREAGQLLLLESLEVLSAAARHALHMELDDCAKHQSQLKLQCLGVAAREPDPATANRFATMRL